jgi:hypothetical protein
VSQVHHLVALALVASVAVTGCQPIADDPSPSFGGNQGGEENLAPEFIPERVPGGSARENQPHIDYVLSLAIEAGRPDVRGVELVAALVEAGYSREDMELTPDASLIELPADSTALTVRFGEECLITQWGSDWYASAVEPVLASDTCLLGETVSLD